MEQKIIDAAFKLIKDKGIKKLNMDDVSRELRISKKTIYKHFESKQHLIVSTLEDFIQKNYRETEKALKGEENWQKKVKGLVASSYAVPMRLLIEIRRDHPEQWLKIEALDKKKIESFYGLMLQGEAQKEMNPEIRHEIVAPMLKEMMNILLRMEFSDDHNWTMRQIYEQLSEILLYGIVKRV